MKFLKFFLISVSFSLAAVESSYANDGPSDSEAMTCNIVFQMTKSTAKDPEMAKKADMAANLFGAYLIKKGMQEQKFISLYDATVKKVQDGMSTTTEANWNKMVDQCVEFLDDM
jgi:hypothetical protein